MKTLLLIVLFAASASVSRALPVEIHSGSHNSVTAKVSSTGGRLYVSGSVAGPLPGLRHPSSHVEVDLINSRGTVIATSWDKIGKPSKHPRTAQGSRERFSVSFPANLSAEAARVRVVYHNHSHGDCENGC